MNATKYSEGDTVIIRRNLTTDEGCHVGVGDIGTLLKDMDDGDWLVYIPAKGSPMLSESDFE
jgi:hypothetical protein